MLTQYKTHNFGLVFITNAEKVVLEKYDDKDKVLVKDLKKGQSLLGNRELEDIQKTNELREALSQIPNLTVILDEVHHSYGSIGNGEKKLRQAITVLNQHDNINTVLGLSGTPYVKSKIEIDEKETIKLNQIQDIVYNYPLNVGIGKFLKIPDIRKSSIKETAFIKQALTDFFNDYDKKYNNNTRSKIAFYCPSIEKLNEDILPLVKEWYEENRKGKGEEIFRYYSNVDKKNKEYALPKESLAIFNNLDKPYSKKRVVLLVAIGAEGWDCKSLTSVVLPRQKTTKNFVLQTTCRCLREVDNAENEKALIYLSEDNYETLDKELKENYKLSISDLTGKSDQTIKVQVRKPKLGKIKYKQIETKYKIVKKSSPDTKRELEKFTFSKYKKKFEYDKAIISGKIGKSGLTGEVSIKDAQIEAKDEIEYNDLLYMISKYSYGLLSEADLARTQDKTLTSIYKKIVKEKEWLYLNPYLEIEDIIRDISACFMDRVEYAKEVIETETVIELLQWQSSRPEMTFISPNGSVYKFMPPISRRNARTYQRHPEDMIEDYFSADNNIDPQDISFNYIPYKMDSEFEQNALQEMLKLSELSGYEVYFNGYKDDKLQSFWIQTPRGRYTPDFLILKRKEGKQYRKDSKIDIEKILILETKGQPYYNDEFKSKEKFVNEEFLKHNKHFKYYCFVDEGKNDFRKHLTKFKEILKEF